MPNKNKNTEMPQCVQTDVMQRCIKCFENILMEYEPDGIPTEWMDDLDFIEILMEVEKEFDISIDEGLNRIYDFKTLDDMAKWLLSFKAA